MHTARHRTAFLLAIFAALWVFGCTDHFVEAERLTPSPTLPTDTSPDPTTQDTWEVPPDSFAPDAPPDTSDDEVLQDTSIDPNPWDLTGASLAVGVNHACVIARSDPQTPGEVWCWGANDESQLGAPPEALANSARPLRVEGLGADVVGIAAGQGFGCALKVDASVWCWGSNHYGQLGDGTFTQSAAPKPVEGLGSAWQVVAGSTHACALLGGGEVACWGNNRSGQLGDGTWAISTTPQPAVDLAQISTLAASGELTCALRALRGGEVLCWGADPRRFGAAPEPRLWLTDVDRFMIGAQTMCAWTEGSPTPRCMGRHPQAIPGLTSGTNLDEPINTAIEVTRLDEASSLVFGERNRCFIDPFGWPWCWGFNDQGQLGPDATQPSTLEPITIPLPGSAAELGIGACSLCGRSERGLVWCWGCDSEGALGRGAPVEGGFDAKPEPVVGLPSL